MLAIPAAYVTAFLPVVYRNVSIRRFTGDFNNVHPRNQVAELESNKKITHEQVRSEVEASATTVESSIFRQVVPSGLMRFNPCDSDDSGYVLMLCMILGPILGALHWCTPKRS